MAQGSIRKALVENTGLPRDGVQTVVVRTIANDTDASYQMVKSGTIPKGLQF